MNQRHEIPHGPSSLSNEDFDPANIDLVCPRCDEVGFRMIRSAKCAWLECTRCRKQLGHFAADGFVLRILPMAKILLGTSKDRIPVVHPDPAPEYDARPAATMGRAEGAIDIPENVMRAASLVEHFFASRNVRRWKLCGIQNRTYP